MTFWAAVIVYLVWWQDKWEKFEACIGAPSDQPEWCIRDW